MGSTKEKRYERLKKKRVWPSILIFVAVAFLCTCMVTAFVTLFTTYIVSTKVENMYEKSVAMGQSIDKLMQKGETIEQIVGEMEDYISQQNAIYITDQEQKPIIKTGASEPDFDIIMSISLSEDITVIGDNGEKCVQWDEGNETFFIPIDEIFAQTFRQSEENESDSEWFHEAVLDKEFWLQIPLKHDEYLFYIKHTLQIQRQDVLYMCAFSIFVVLMLLIPIVFLFINTIRAVVMQQKMTKMLYTDIVTGGWNWFYFQNYAGRILTRHKNRKKTYAFVELHLERYHNYCACYGMKAGEELLENMDVFLRARTAKGEIHARYEGADFVMLLCCKGADTQENQNYFQKRLRSLLAELTGLRPDQKLHFAAGVHMLYPNISANGRRYLDRKNIDISQLYSYANTARMEVKRQEEHRISFFDQGMLDKQLWRRRVEEGMEAALREEQFQIYLQPKYNPTGNRLVGAEALVRWKSQTGEIIPPDRFIPILEESGFIAQLDDYMVSHVAKMQAEWTLQGKKVVPISVNISRAHLVQEGLAEHICQLVDAYGPKHELIELEVKESAFFDEKDILIETVKQLRAYGFRVSMDDFGTGYSSLNSLKDIPLDVLKLDIGFFHDEGDSKRGEIIVREAIRLARGLNMRVVAEGIEKKEQVEFLTELECDMIQGFYFAKPMPVCEFEEKVEKDA